MNLLHEIISVDKAIFFFINHNLANPIFDVFMPLVTNDWNLRIFLIFIWLLLMIFGGRRGRTVALLLIPALFISDQLSSHVMKPLIGRVRPCHELDGVRLLVGCGSGLSFPSSHAVNSFTVAILISRFYKKYLYPLLLFAFLVSFSRVYIGVHYPLDVLVGSAIGLCIGFALAYTYFAIYTKLNQNKTISNREST